MTSARANATAKSARPPVADETPWYDLISEVPEPPEDAMQQADTILEVMSILRARYEDDPTTLVSGQSNVIYDSNTPGSVVEPDRLDRARSERRCRDHCARAPQLPHRRMGRPARVRP